MEIRKIGIAGAGLMGAGMSQIFARRGYDVVVYDAFESALEKRQTAGGTESGGTGRGGRGDRDEKFLKICNALYRD